MDLHHLLVNLETLHTDKRFDPEDRALMKQYMIEVANYEALILLKENPVFLALLQNFREEIKQINGWILQNAKDIAAHAPAIENKAMYLIAKKETLQDFVDHYSAEPVELIAHIKDRTNHFLEKYKINQ